MSASSDVAKAEAPARERLAEQVARVFPKDVAEHVMTVRLEQGVYRHLEFRHASGTSVQWFTITTWPGELCISGDMGTFVFRRLRDMFEFFRSNGNDRGINASYWREKLQAPARRDATEYDADIFRERVTEWMNGYIEGNDLDDEDAEDLRRNLSIDVLVYADEGEREAIGAAMRFKFKGRHPMQDFYEANCREYTFQFLWCCHAIVWAIAQWDAWPKTERAA